MKTILIAAVVLIGGVAFADTDRSSAQLALDKGCFACHGEPPRKNSPTFDQLAKDFARYQGQPEQELVPRPQPMARVPSDLISNSLKRPLQSIPIQIV